MRSERESVISSGQNLRVEPEYFHILLSDLRIYFLQTGSDCGQTSLSACLSLYSGCPVQSSDTLFEYAGRQSAKHIFGQCSYCLIITPFTAYLTIRDFFVQSLISYDYTVLIIIRAKIWGSRQVQ